LDSAAKKQMITDERMAWIEPPTTYVDNNWQKCWQDVNELGAAIPQDGVAIPQYPTNTNLMMVSPHRRNDPSPKYGQANYHEHNDISTTSAGGFLSKGKLGSAVRAYFEGHGVWQRYEVNNLPSFADVNTMEKAASIFKAAETAADDVTAKCGQGKTCVDGIPVAPLQKSQQDAVASANTLVDDNGGISKFQNDVYAPVPIGKSGDVSFHPGTNQVWLVLTQDRITVLNWVAVGADSSGKTACFYVGSGEGVAYNTKMVVLFDQFSSPLNPLTFQMNYDRQTGLPVLSMTIKHYQDQQIYGEFSLHFTQPSSNSNYTAFVDSWMHSAFPTLRSDELFIQKALQIWNLCNCYQFNPSDLFHCLSIGGDRPLWFKIEAMIATALLNLAAKEQMITNERMAWIEPPTTFLNYRWQKCWQDVTVSASGASTVADTGAMGASTTSTTELPVPTSTSTPASTPASTQTPKLKAWR